MIASVLTLPVRLVVFVLWFLKEVVVSSLTVVLDAVRPGSDATPRVVRLPVDDAPAWHVTLIAMLITLTPGTLTLGISPPSDRQGRALMVHSMYHADNPAALASLDDMFRRMQRALAVGGGTR